MPNRFVLPREAYKGKAPLDAHQLPIYLFFLQYFTCNSAEPDRERGRAKKKKQNRNRNKQTMKNQTTSCYTCKNKTEDNPRPLWGIQPLAPPGGPESR